MGTCRDQGLHARVAFVEATVNPEGLEIGPDGRFAVATNIEDPWLAKDDPHYTPYSTVLLMEIDGARSRPSKHDDAILYGELPEGAALDANSHNALVTSVADSSDTGADGARHHFRIVATATRRGYRMAPTDVVIPVRRGAHHAAGPHRRRSRLYARPRTRALTHPWRPPTPGDRPRA